VVAVTVGAERRRVPVADDCWNKVQCNQRPAVGDRRRSHHTAGLCHLQVRWDHYRYTRTITGTLAALAFTLSSTGMLRWTTAAILGPLAVTLQDCVVHKYAGTTAGTVGLLHVH